MTKMKKAISITLAIVLIAGMFAFSAFAAEQNAAFTVTASATQIEAGDTITVTVSATTDYYAAATSIPVHYDNTLFNFVAGSVKAADIFGTGATDVRYYNNLEKGYLLVTFTPRSRVQNVKAQILNDVELVSFQLTAKADGTSALGLDPADQKTTEYGNTGPLYCGAYADASITSAVTAAGQTFTLKNTSVTIGSAAVPVLQLSETGAANGAVIDKTSLCNDGAGFIYGINTDIGESIADALATPAGSIRVTENEMGVMSTGAKIELLDGGGNVVETYYFIFFGDVNGDGWVDATDVSSVEGTATYSDFDYAADDGSLMGMAADINGDGWVDATDVSYVEGVATYFDFPTQAETAAEVAASKGV